VINLLVAKFYIEIMDNFVWFKVLIDWLSKMMIEL